MNYYFVLHVAKYLPIVTLIRIKCKITLKKKDLVTIVPEASFDPTLCYVATSFLH